MKAFSFFYIRFKHNMSCSETICRYTHYKYEHIQFMTGCIVNYLDAFETSENNTSSAQP